MARSEVLYILKKGVNAKCTEALFTFGEQPEVYPDIKERLEEWGYSSIIEYLYDLCLDAIELGLLPHSNPGSLKKSDLEFLKEVNSSMGLMLESSSKRLCDAAMPHEKSPGKYPTLRLKVIENAGKLSIPFTTGVLIGIGETDSEVVDSLKALRKIQNRYGHIQEIIIQNFRPTLHTPMENSFEPSLDRVIFALESAEKLFPDIGLQVPPNLNPGREGVFLHHGANDFGGISPVTPDYVNPGDQWPTVEYLRSVASGQGFVLRERLPVYPKFLDFVPERLKRLTASYVGKDGFVK
jgi:FO synthase subunit 1